MDIFDCWIYIVKNMNMFEQMPFSEKYPVFRKLAEIGDLRKLSREELELYDEDIKNMRDIYATRKFDEKITRRFSNISGSAYFLLKKNFSTLNPCGFQNKVVYLQAKHS